MWNLVELWSSILLTLLSRLLTEFAFESSVILGNLDINSEGKKLVRTGTKRGSKLELNHYSNLPLYEVARFLSTQRRKGQRCEAAGKQRKKVQCRVVYYRPKERKFSCIPRFLVGHDCMSQVSLPRPILLHQLSDACQVTHQNMPVMNRNATGPILLYDLRAYGRRKLD